MFTEWVVRHDELLYPDIEDISVYFSNFEFTEGVVGQGRYLIETSTTDWSRGYNYSYWFNKEITTSSNFDYQSDIGTNLDGDTENLDQCLTALPENGPGSFGYYININLKETYEISRLRVIFAYDWPNGQDMSETPLNPNIAIWFYAWDEKNGGERVRITGLGWWTMDFDTNGVPKEDTIWWEANVKTQAEAPITRNISVYVSANGGDYLNDDSTYGNYDGFAICEIRIWGLFVSAHPTTVPTMDPVAPSQAPTLAPSESPTSTPSLAPSAAPTPDACPNFEVKQPCCASNGGYHYVNNSYDRRTNELIADDEIESKCYLVFEDQQCCGNGTYTPILGSNTIGCNIDGSIETGRDIVCDPSLLTDKVNKTWYGYDVYFANTTTYIPADGDSQCTCRFDIYVCEVRTELECIGSDVPYPDDDVLCAISSNDASPFVGGGETDILMFSNATIDDNAQTCECDYMADNCLDDIDKRDYFDIIGDEDDNDTCTVNFIQDCCEGSEMSFGGVAISSLDLTTYANLSQQGATWACLNGYGLCDIDGLPTMVDIKETFFSWVYNEYDSGNIGFEANTLCECLVVYNNCTTTAPTQDTKAPTTDPTSQPSTTPTMAPTKYQFDDYDDITVGQPCCGDADVTINPGNKCPSDNSSICLVSRFQGNSNRIRKNMDNPFTIDNGNCLCRFDVGYWNWNVPSGKRLKLPVTTWTEILDNITWNNASRVPLFDTDRRRLLQTDTNCFNFYVVECGETSECMEESAPIAQNDTNLIQVIGSTLENWTNFSADGLNEIEEEQCFCYYMYYTCNTPPTTTIPDVISTSELPTMNDTDAATTTTKNPVGAPETSEGASTAEDPFYEEYITLAEENPIIAGAAGAGLFLFCCMTCVLCCKRCKQRKAEKDREQLEKYKSEDQEEKQKDAPPSTTQTKPKSADEGGGLDIAETAPIVPKGTSRGGPTETQPTQTQQPTQTKPPAKERVPDTESQSGYTIEMQQAARPPAAVVGAAFESTPQPEVKQAEENYETEYDEDVYSVQFTEKPFGITFGGSKKDKDNLLVQGIDGGSAGAKLNVIVGSTVVRFEDEEVEGLGPKKIFKIFKGKYADMLPLRITFRKPQNLEEGDGVEDEANGGYEEPAPPVPAAPAEPVVEENEQNEQAQEYENGAEEEYAEENAEQNEEQYDENYNENYDENQENYDENAEYDEEYEYYED